MVKTLIFVARPLLAHYTHNILYLLPTKSHSKDLVPRCNSGIYEELRNYRNQSSHKLGSTNCVWRESNLGPGVSTGNSGQASVFVRHNWLAPGQKQSVAPSLQKPLCWGQHAHHPLIQVSNIFCSENRDYIETWRRLWKVVLWHQHLPCYIFIDLIYYIIRNKLQWVNCIFQTST